MDSSHRSSARTTPIFLHSAAFATVLALFGCASPGPPRAPTLSLPEPVRDLAVTRIGNTVELRFTAPTRTTDKLPIRGAIVTGQLCRELEHQSCQPVASSKAAVNSVGPNGARSSVTWIDTLPTDLTQGSPRLLAYRVEFFSPTGRSAGTSAPAFTVAGTPPAPVEDLRATGSRLGVVLEWKPSAQPGDVVLERESKAPSSPKPHKNKDGSSAPASPLVWLGTHSSSDSTVPLNRTLDTTALPDVPYSYTAQRRITLQLGGHTIEFRSSLSPSISFILNDLYPPLEPTGLTAVGFFASEAANSAATYAVDLIWQPVDDSGLLAGLAGYNIYREPVDATNTPLKARTRLNAAPIRTPAFHDTTANPSTRYSYSVSAIDSKGNESPTATVLLEPSAAP